MHKNPLRLVRDATAVRGALRLTLLASALALAGCASSHGSGDRHSGTTPPPSHLSSSESPLQTALGTTGGAVDNVADAGLESVLGQAGQRLDGPLEPLYKAVDSTTQALGAQTGLGKPVDGVLKQAGGAVEGLGAQLGGIGLPGGLSKGAGALTSGAGGALAAAGGLLNKSEDNPNPLTRTLAAASGGVDGLTGALTSPGGLLQPLSSPLNHALGGALGADGQPILEPALGNTGKAVDQVLPLGLQKPLGDAGRALDGVVVPVGGAVTQLTQKVGDGLSVGAPVDQLLTSLGGSLQQAGSGAGASIPGLGGVVSNLGATIASAGGIVHDAPAHANPLGSTLDHATQAIVALTGGLSVADTVPADGGSIGGLLGGLTRTGIGHTSTGGTVLAGPLGDQANPVGELLGGVAGGSGLLGGILGGLGGK